MLRSVVIVSLVQFSITPVTKADLYWFPRNSKGCMSVSLLWLGSCV